MSKIFHAARLHARPPGRCRPAILTSRRGSPWSQRASVSTLPRRSASSARTGTASLPSIWARAVYGGLWVGKSRPSPISTAYRRQAVEYLKGLVPVLRWRAVVSPTNYHWRDGVGPAARRAQDGQYLVGETTSRTTASAPMSLSAVPWLIGAEPTSGVQRRQRDAGKKCATGWSTAITQGSSLLGSAPGNGARSSFQCRSYWGRGQ